MRNLRVRFLEGGMVATPFCYSTSMLDKGGIDGRDLHPGNSLVTSVIRYPQRCGSIVESVF